MLEIILVNDCEISNLMMKLMMNKYLPGVEVSICMNGAQALGCISEKTEKFESETWSAIVFLDLNMPIMDGWQFLEQLHNMKPEIRTRMSIYVVTALLITKIKERLSTEKYVSGYFEMPIKASDILKSADEHCRRLEHQIPLVTG